METSSPVSIQPTQKSTYNKNYYNTSNSYNPASGYDSYYSIYDDDVDLYRDAGKLGVRLNY